MNITMNRAELLHAVKHAAAVAPANSPLEALKGVLLEVSAASKSLVLTATNLEVTLKQKLACAAPEDDALAIDARLLARMLEKLPGDTVELRRKPGDSRLAQMCEDKDEFRAGANGKNIVFVREGFLFSARLIQEKYIDTDFLTSSLKNQFTVLTDVAELRRALDNVSCVEPDGKVQLSFEGMTLSFRCGGVHGSAQNVITVAPLTGMPQGEYWYLTKRLNNCLRSLSGTATLGIAAGGMLTLDTEHAFYMQAGVRPGAPQSVPQKEAKKPAAGKKAA